MFQGSKWYEYNSIHMRKENYVNLLDHQDKSKLLEWMENNKLHGSIRNFVWDPKSKTWKPKF